jgi:hypothetical protein
MKKPSPKPFYTSARLAVLPFFFREYGFKNISRNAPKSGKIRVRSARFLLRFTEKENQRKKKN